MNGELERVEASSAPRANRGLLAILLAACLSGFVSAGCGQILGVDDYKVAAPNAKATPPSACGAWTYEGAKCGACMDRSCCNEATKCQLDPTCNAFGACEAACAPGDSACAASCAGGPGWDGRVQGAYMAAESLELEACRSRNCSSDCGTLQSQGETCGFPRARSECGACCCGETATCAKDPDCLRAYACFVACGATIDPSAILSDPCLDDCLGRAGMAVEPDAGATDAGSAVSTAADLWQCFSTRGRCSAPCQVVDWSCAGKVVMPPPSHEPLTFYQQVLDIGSKPVSGLDVQECGRGDADCTAPRTHGTTDENGWVPLPISLGFPGIPDVYFDFTDRQTPPRFIEVLVFPLSLTHSESSPVFDFPPTPSALPGLPDPKPARGVLLVYQASCIDAGGGTVTVTPSDDSTQVQYLRNGALDPAATCTDNGGSALISNVLPSRSAKVEVRRCDTNELVGSAAVIVRAGVETQVSVGPFEN